jgi:hypothetical protein
LYQNCIQQDCADCGCPEQVVLQKDSKAVFRDLSHTEDYFPMIARMHAQAFFGLPPKALLPKAPELRVPSRSVSTSGRNLNSSQVGSYNDFTTSVERHQTGGDNDSFEISSSDEAVMDISSPIYSHLSQSSLNGIPKTPVRYSGTSKSISPSALNLADEKSKEEIAKLMVRYYSRLMSKLVS